MKRITLILLILFGAVLPVMAQEATSEPAATVEAPAPVVEVPAETPAPIIIAGDGSASVNWSYVFNIVLLIVVLVQQFLATGKLAPEKVQQIIDRARVGANATKDNPYDNIAVDIVEAVTKALIAQQAKPTPPAQPAG